MEFSVTSANPATRKSGAVVVGVFERRRLSDAAAGLDEASNGYLKSVLANGDLDGEPGTSLMLHNVPGIAARRVLLVGCGKSRELDLKAFRRASATAAQALERSGARDALSCLAAIRVRGADTHALARATVEATEAGCYRFDEFKSEPDPPAQPLERLALALADREASRAAEAGVAEARAIAAGVALARDLANRPANVCTPTHLAEQAQALAADFPSVTTTVLEESDMAELGMGALLAVSQGSRQPAKLITMEYRGAGSGARPHVFVGKGVTFDSGGISIKPAQAMDEMKYDMGGAAGVFGAVRACAEMGLEANVVGIVPAVENMPDGNATRPGDIVTTMSGQTIEILSTDAEGRMILCDALTYAQRFEPHAIIDIATLTGACIIALGTHASALLSPNDALARQLAEAGERSGDRCWRLPLWDDYQEQLKSPFADFANTGGRPAGTITAACFLSRFTRDYPRWAHLDIAGIAWTSGEDKGATGRPVPLLMQFLLDQCAAAR